MPTAKPEEVGLSTERMKRIDAAAHRGRQLCRSGAYGWPGGSGVAFWMIQGGSGGALRQEFENAVRQAIVD